MSRSDKFASLNHYFSELKADEISLTFKDIEKIIGGELCYSAYNYREYWYADRSHKFPNCWIDNGYEMSNLNLDEKIVTYKKTGLLSEAPRTYSRKNSITKRVTMIRKKPTISIEKIISGINKFYSELGADANARYLSWEHCYKVFHETHKKTELTEEDFDYLSLNLGFYLASWGMYRGSSFLLQKDYKVHIDIIKELLRDCYGNLWGINYIELQKQQNLDTLMDLINKMKTIYDRKRKNIKEVETDISDILVSKVLLGTLGCIPAYDKYFKMGIAENSITTQSLSESSLKGLAEYYENNEKELENIRNSISKERQVVYPQMKVLDMAFWQLGFDNIKNS